MCLCGDWVVIYGFSDADGDVEMQGVNGNRGSWVDCEVFERYRIYNISYFSRNKWCQEIVDESKLKFNERMKDKLRPIDTIYSNFREFCVIFVCVCVSFCNFVCDCILR